MRYDPARHRLCVITDRRLSGAGHERVAELALDGGATFLQLRDKEMTTRELLEVAQALRRLAREREALFVVNDRADVAAACGADGVHVGRDDLPVAAARALLGPEAVVGASARTVEEAREAEEAGADYLGVGPVYEARATKPDATAPRGLRLIRDIVATVRIPVVAIGGIDRTNAAEVLRAGAHGVAVVSAVAAAKDVAGATADLLRVIGAAAREERR